MRKQRGQTLVEFALMAPMMFLLIFGMIYGGIMFVDYLNFNNEARTLARQIAVADTTAERSALMTKYKEGSADTSFTRFYNIKMVADYGYADSDTAKNTPIDAVVTISFDRKNDDLPNVLKAVHFPPEHFAIQYKMKLEKISS